MLLRQLLDLERQRCREPVGQLGDVETVKHKSMLTLVSLALLAGCSAEVTSDSSYVLIRSLGADRSAPALRAYFVDGDARLNGVDCRELMTLANEAVTARISRGETHLVKYECVSLREARERGFK